MSDMTHDPSSGSPAAHSVPLEHDDATPEMAPTNAAVSRPRRRWTWIIASLLAIAGILLVVDRVLRPAVGELSELVIGNRADSDSPRRNGSITAPLSEPLDPDVHPLVPALEVARAGLAYLQENVADYEATFIKQERMGKRLGTEEQALVRIRQARQDGSTTVPFSVYMRFLAPQSIAGREVIYVDGQNDGKLIAHEAGILGLATVHLLPTSRLAMRGNRHPITEIGLQNMILRMIEKGERDLAHGECQLEVDRSITINGHPATEIKLIHPHRRDHFDYHVAKILIDDELNVPVGYEGYTWPDEEGGEPVLQERYYYADLKLNVGLTDRTFDPENEEYDFR